MSSTCNSIVNLKVIDEILLVLSLYKTTVKLDSASENPTNHLINSSEKLLQLKSSCSPTVCNDFFLGVWEEFNFPCAVKANGASHLNLNKEVHFCITWF